MAVVGEQLLQPESGWRRYNSTNPLIKFDSSFIYSSYTGHYINDNYYTSTIGGTLKFCFYGTKLRIYGYQDTSRGNVSISIDGNVEIFSQSGSAVFQTLQYEKTGLDKKIHVIEMKNIDKSMDLDAIDIDEDGELIRYDYFDKINLDEPIRKYGVAWFGFDEASGSVYDKLGSNYVGTVTGATRVSGWNGEGSAMSFNGSNQYVRFVNPIQKDEKTIRLKFKPLSIPTDSRIIFSTSEGSSSYIGIALQLTNDGTINLFGYNGTSYNIGIQSHTKLIVNKWYDIMIVFEGGLLGDKVEMYIDGKFENTTSITANESNYSTILMLGRYPSAGYYINGELDDFQLYSKALTPADFTQQRLAIKTADNKNLILPVREGRVKEILSSEETDLINQGYSWREIDNAVDGGIDLTRTTTEYEIVTKTNSSLTNGKVFTIPVENFKTIKVENNIDEDKHLVLHEGQYKYHNGNSWLITNGSEADFIQYGMNDLSQISEAQWVELTGSKSIMVWTDVEDKKYVSIILIKEPFTAKDIVGDNAELILHTESTSEQLILNTEVDNYSVYDYISELPTVVAYTESTDDIIVSTITEPFDLYDEFGDEVEVLFYTDDEAVTEADLILEANWSPIDELEGDFEVVTWTDEGSDTAQRVLEMTAIPKPQFVKLANPKHLYGYLEKVLAVDASTSYRDEVRYLFTDDKATKWYVWSFDSKTFVEVDASTHELILKNGMKYTDVALLTQDNWVTWGRDYINIGIFLKDNPRDTIVSVVDSISYQDYLPRHSESVSNASLYILNTTAKIDLTMIENSVTGALSDDDLTRVQYRVILNGSNYYPSDGSFTNLSPSPTNISITIPSTEVIVDQQNTLRIEFKDYFGTTDYWEANFIGTYTGLLFKDIYGDYYSNEIGEVLKYLDFGVIIAGQTTLEHEVILRNSYGYDVKNIRIFANSDSFPEGMSVQFSERLTPFIPQSTLTIPDVLANESEISFFVRLKTELGSTPEANGSFEIFVKADKA